MWFTRVCGAASPFCVGWSRSRSVESTFSCLFLSRLKKGLNYSDPGHLECCFSSGRGALKWLGEKVVMRGNCSLMSFNCCDYTVPFQAQRWEMPCHSLFSGRAGSVTSEDEWGAAGCP